MLCALHAQTRHCVIAMQYPLIQVARDWKLHAAELLVCLSIPVSLAYTAGLAWQNCPSAGKRVDEWVALEEQSTSE